VIGAAGVGRLVRCAELAEVVAGPVPEHLDGAVHTGPLDAAAPGRYLLVLPGVGRFLVTAADPAGITVTVDSAPGATDADLACLLDGPIRQACRLLRGGYALRGAGVVIGGGAVAITGLPASGKSAVAAALARRGCPVLADGAQPIRFGPAAPAAAATTTTSATASAAASTSAAASAAAAVPGGRLRGGPVAWPADDGVQIWRDVIDDLGLDPDDGEPVRPGLAKRRFRFPAAGPAPLAAVVVLHREPDVGDVRVEQLRGREAMDAVVTYTAMRPLIAPLGLGGQHFAWSVRLTGSVRVMLVRSDRHRRDLADVADAVEALVGPGPVAAVEPSAVPLPGREPVSA
jgi:hypothetical protein